MYLLKQHIINFTLLVQVFDLFYCDSCFTKSYITRVLCIPNAMLCQVIYQESLLHQKIYTYGAGYVMRIQNVYKPMVKVFITIHKYCARKHTKISLISNLPLNHNLCFTPSTVFISVETA